MNITLDGQELEVTGQRIMLRESDSGFECKEKKKMKVCHYPDTVLYFDEYGDIRKKKIDKSEKVTFCLVIKTDDLDPYNEIFFFNDDKSYSIKSFEVKMWSNTASFTSNKYSNYEYNTKITDRKTWNELYTKFMKNDGSAVLLKELVFESELNDKVLIKATLLWTGSDSQ
jgi:hypothetical protein